MNRWLRALELQRSEGEDVDAQIDGDVSPPFVPPAGMQGSPFAAAQGAQPWLREGLPPWHMWGNSQLVTLVGGAFGSGTANTVQLIKTAYKRPETWHWLLVGKILTGPEVVNPQIAGIQIDFDLIVGIGRSVVQMPSVESFSWAWDDTSGPATARANPIWSSSFVARNRVLRFGPSFPAVTAVPNIIEEIVAQDIQLNVRGIDIGNFVGNNITVEVSAYFSPKTHVRPDWFNNFDGVPPEKVFTGAETEGH